MKGFSLPSSCACLLALPEDALHEQVLQPFLPSACIRLGTSKSGWGFSSLLAAQMILRILRSNPCMGRLLTAFNMLAPCPLIIDDITKP